MKGEDDEEDGEECPPDVGGHAPPSDEAKKRTPECHAGAPATGSGTCPSTAREEAQLHPTLKTPRTGGEGNRIAKENNSAPELHCSKAVVDVSSASHSNNMENGHGLPSERAQSHASVDPSKAKSIVKGDHDVEKNQNQPHHAPQHEGGRIIARLREQLEIEMMKLQKSDQDNPKQESETTNEPQNKAQELGKELGLDIFIRMKPKAHTMPPTEERTFRDWVWLSLENPGTSTWGYLFAMFIFIMIVVSTLSFVLETMRDLYDFAPWFQIEVMCIAAFSLEYFLRLLVCPKWAYTGEMHVFTWLVPNLADFDDPFMMEIFARFRFCLQPMNMVDLIAILPTLIQWMMADTFLRDSGALADLTAVRITRLFRLFRLIGYSEGRMMFLLSKTMSRSWRMLRTLMIFWAIAVLMFSSIMYFAERGKFFYCSEKAAALGMCTMNEIRRTSTDGYDGLEDCNGWAAQKNTLKEKMLKCCNGEAW
jgi:hypothetical protein